MEKREMNQLYAIQNYYNLKFDDFEFLQFFWDKYIILNIIIYFNLALSNFVLVGGWCLVFYILATYKVISVGLCKWMPTSWPC